jgi:putative flippase GtrA
MLKEATVQFLRYFVVGGLAAVLDIFIFAVFSSWLGFDYLLVGALGYGFCTFLNYWLSIHFVFVSGVRFGKMMELGAVYLVSGVALFLHTALLFALVEFLLLPSFPAKLISSASVLVWNFSARKYWIFRENNKRF